MKAVTVMPARVQDRTADGMVGAALTPRVTVVRGALLARVGAWITVPAGVQTVTVTVGGTAWAQGLVVPTAVRVRAAVQPRHPAAVWQGAALRPWHGGLRATVVLPGVSSGQAFGALTVVELAGMAGERPGQGTVDLGVEIPGGVHRTVTVGVTVTAGEPVGDGVMGASVALDATPAEAAGSLARWTDGYLGALAAAGYRPVRPRVRVSRATVGTVEASVGLGPGGLKGDGWVGVVRAVASGGVSGVSLWSPCAVEAWGLSAAVGTRSRPGVTEMTAWVSPRVVPGTAARWAAAMETVCCALRGRLLQAVVGRLDEPVAPRAITAWELTRGMGDLPAEVGWLGRYIRGPGSWARCGETVVRGEDVRAVWPDAAAWAGWITPRGAGARSAAVRALWRRLGTGSAGVTVPGEEWVHGPPGSQREP